ncbi:MAG: hypothetical protein OQL19_21220 [Gammaproteobacteria bacterium]|nr:hypothetical protein [Gammaproteobacteria bacterium]
MNISIKKILSAAIISLSILTIPTISMAHEHGYNDGHFKYKNHKSGYKSHFKKHYRDYSHHDERHHNKHYQHHNYKYSKHNHRYNKHYAKHHGHHYKRDYVSKKHIKPHKISALHTSIRFIFN